MTKLGGNFTLPSAVAVDGGGDVYVADSSNRAVTEMPAGCASASCVTTLGGFSNPTGVALDGSGNVYIADYGDDQLNELNRASPPALFFASTEVGSTSNDSPRTVTVLNAGNRALSLTGLTYPADFPRNSGNVNPCTVSSDLNPGQDCDILINFTPLSPGNLSEGVTLTDNTSNVPAATQTIAVSGTGKASTSDGNTKCFGAGVATFSNTAIKCD